MTIQEQKRILVEYLKLMTYREDWHGVRDAAADLEQMAANESCLSKLKRQLVDEITEKEKETLRIKKEIEDAKFRWSCNYGPGPIEQFQKKPTIYT